MIIYYASLVISYFYGPYFFGSVTNCNSGEIKRYHLRYSNAILPQLTFFSDKTNKVQAQLIYYHLRPTLAASLKIPIGVVPQEKTLSSEPVSTAVVCCRLVRKTPNLTTNDR